jgi:hypothetical protein
MATDGIITYPAGAIKLNKFLGPNIALLVDGMRFENHRLDVVFPSEAEVRKTIARLVRVAIANREDAVKFILDVLDEYHPILESGPVNTKDIVG